MEDLYGIICHIKCGDMFGSGFLISNNHIVTASHTLAALNGETDEKVYVFFENEDIDNLHRTAFPDNAHWMEYSIAVLKLSEDMSIPIRQISGNGLYVNDTVYTYGFYSSVNNTAMRIKFRVDRLSNQPVQGENCNTVLIPDERKCDFAGYSGSPLVKDGQIVGVVLRQRTENGNAFRVDAICGTLFRNALSDQYPSILFNFSDGSSTGVTKNQIVPVAAGIDFLAEIDLLKSKEFEPILAERISGDIIKSWHDMDIFLFNLTASNCSASKKAEYYNIAAIWALQDAKNEKANHYHAEAEKWDSGYDDRPYRGYIALQSGNINEAMDILMPINTAMVLNTYLICIFQSGKSASEASAVIKATINDKNRQTYMLLSMFALREGDLSAAEQYLNEVDKLVPESLELAVCRAILLFWKAMISYYICENHFGFVYGGTAMFSLTSEQNGYLEDAYCLLDRANQRITDKANNNTMQILSGLVVISALLPNKDCAAWLSEIWKYEQLYPFGILVGIDQRLAIPEAIEQDFLKNNEKWESYPGYIRAKIEMLRALGRTDEMWSIFENNKGKLIDEGISPVEYQIELLIETQKYNEANILIKRSVLSNIKKERFQIGLMSREGRVPNKQLVKRALALAKRTKIPIDFYNANLICERTGRWKEQEKNGKEWRRNGGGNLALENIAGSLIHQNKYIKARKIIDQAKSQGDISERIRQHELNCLVGESKFNEALALTESFENVRSNPRLVVFRANIFRGQGQKKKATEILRRYADEDLYDYEVYQQLISDLEEDNPDSAFEYACRLYDHDPNNEQYACIAGMVCIKTGHSERNDIISHIFSAASAGQSQFKMIDIAEAMKMIEEQREYTQGISKMYQSLVLPVHLVVDAAGSDIGSTVYHQWKSNTPILARYGGKPISEDIRIGDEILLDYTMCLTIAELGLFNQFEKMFSKIWLPHDIFLIWDNDLKKLKTVQHHVVERDLYMAEKLKSLHYQVYDVSYPSEMRQSKINFSDFNLLRYAEDNSALFIEEEPFGKLMGEITPKEWYNYQAYPCELYSALHELKLAAANYDATKRRDSVVEKLISRKTIILTLDMLYNLMEQDSIDIVFENFRVILPEDVVYQIRIQAEKHQIRRDAVEWLEKAQKQMAELLKNGHIQLAPSYGSGDSEDASTPNSRLLKEEMLAIEALKCHWGIDDRCVSGMGTNVGPKSLILSTLDIIHNLYCKKIISEVEFFTILDKMIKNNYGFIIPPPEYVFSRLVIAQPNEMGELEENAELARIRKSIAWSLDDTFGIACSCSKTIHRIEAIDFYAALLQMYRICLASVWNAEREIEWKRAASSWLLMFINEYPCDIQRSEFNSPNNIYAVKQAMVILDLITQREYWEEYLNWAFSYLYCSWTSNPRQIEKTAKNYVRFFGNACVDVAKQISTENRWLLLKKYYLCDFLQTLPKRFVEQIYSLPEGQKMMTELNLSVVCSPIAKTSVFSELSAVKPEYKDIISGNPDAMETALLWIFEHPEIRGQELLDNLSEKALSSVDKENRYILSCFFGTLAWYLPCELQHVAQARKRFLSRLEDA